MRRALFVTLSLMRPKMVEGITAVGLSNDGLFKTLRASTRKLKLTFSVILSCFESDASHWKEFGARKKLRPVFPIDPGAGAANWLRVLASNQKLRPLSNTRAPL